MNENAPLTQPELATVVCWRCRRVIERVNGERKPTPSGKDGYVCRTPNLARTCKPSKATVASRAKADK